MAAATGPTLSVVVAVTDGAVALRRVLGDLAAQRGVPAPDVIVVDGTGTLSGVDVAGVLPGGVSLLARPGADVSLLRTVGARAATGELVAFTEDHCRLPAEWCSALLGAYAAGHRAFGGVVEQGSFRAPPDWAAFLVEFSAFMPPLAGGPTDTLSGINVAYERMLIEGLLDGPLCEPIVHGRLRELGVPLHLVPSARVTFERRFGVVAFARHCIGSGRTFAGLRLAHAAAARRAGYALAAATALPPVLAARIGARVFMRRQARRAFLLALPWIALYTLAWGLGEAQGALMLGPAGGGVGDLHAAPLARTRTAPGEPSRR